MTKRKKFTSEFKREAVRLMESSSKSNNLQASYASAVYNKRLRGLDPESRLSTGPPAVLIPPGAMALVLI